MCVCVWDCVLSLPRTVISFDCLFLFVFLIARLLFVPTSFLFLFFLFSMSLYSLPFVCRRRGLDRNKLTATTTTIYTATTTTTTPTTPTTSTTTTTTTTTHVTHDTTTTTTRTFSRHNNTIYIYIYISILKKTLKLNYIIY